MYELRSDIYIYTYFVCAFLKPLSLPTITFTNMYIIHYFIELKKKLNKVENPILRRISNESKGPESK